MAIWRDVDDWRYELHPLDTPAEAFGRFESFVSLWRSKWRDGMLPAWSHFDIMDFVGWWGWISVFDIVEREPFTIRIRLVGVQATDVLGYEATRQVLSVVDDDLPNDAKHITNDDLEYYQEIMNRRCLGLTVGPMDMDLRAMGMFHEVSLPLSDDGVAVDKLMFAGSIDRIRPGAAGATR